MLVIPYIYVVNTNMTLLTAATCNALCSLLISHRLCCLTV